MSRYAKDHLKGLNALTGTTRGAGSFLGVAFKLTRMALAYHEASEANRVIDEGTISGKLEDSRLGTLDDLRKAGLLGDHGYLVGHMEGQAVRLNKDHHLAIMAAAGFGKSSTQSIPNIIHLAKGGPSSDGKESLIILDWKNAELARSTAQGVEELTGTKPFILKPYDALNNVQINVFQDLIDGAQSGDIIVDETRARVYPFFAQALQDAGANGWIIREASSLAEFVVVARGYLDPDALTLGGLWDFAHASFDEISAFMEVAATYEDVAGGYVAAGARAFLNAYDPDDLREWRWIMQAFRQAFILFAPGSLLRTATERTTVDIPSFKLFPQTLYIVIPDRHLLSAAAFVSCLLDYIVETAAHAEGPQRVSILAEEFSALPFSEAVAKWLRMYRALGIRLITVVQDRDGYKKFFKIGGYKLFEQNSARILFGISDPAHLRDLEARAGKRAVFIETRSTNMGIRTPGKTKGATEQLTPVFPASVAATIGMGRVILDIAGQPLYVLDAAPWWEQPDISSYCRDTRPGS